MSQFCLEICSADQFVVHLKRLTITQAGHRQERTPDTTTDGAGTRKPRAPLVPSACVRFARSSRMADRLAAGCRLSNEAARTAPASKTSKSAAGLGTHNSEATSTSLTSTKPAFSTNGLATDMSASACASGPSGRVTDGSASRPAASKSQPNVRALAVPN